MAWGDNLGGSGGGGSIFLRLQPGGKTLLAFVGDPVEHRVVWVEGKSAPFDPAIHDASEAKTRVKCNVYLPDADKMQIAEFSGQFARETVAPVVRKYGQDTVFEYSREGSGMDTRYALLFERKLTVAEQAAITELDEFDLSPPATSSAAADLPVAGAKASAKDQADVMDLLIKSGSDVMAPFYARFGVSRLSDLRADQVNAAKTFIKSYVAGDDDQIPF